MQAFREELKEKDAKSLQKQHEYEARIQEVETQLQQGMKIKSQPTVATEEHARLLPELDECMELITPDVAATLSVIAQKQKAARHSRKHVQEHRTHDAEMESDLDGDHRDAGSPRTVQFVSASPEPVVNFLIKSIPHD